MAVVQTPRSRWIEAGLRALAEGGPEAVRVEPIARALGVSKGGFYWHFADRATFIAELLETWQRVGVDAVIERVEGEGGDARAKLRRLFGIAMSGEVEGVRGSDLLRIDLAVREWAGRDKRVAARLRRVDNRRMAYMRSLFGEFCPEREAEARSLLAFSVWIGHHFLAADYGSHDRAEILALALSGLLEEPPASV